MADDVTRISLRPEHFDDAERVLARFGGLTASTFRYTTGVEGLRIENGIGRVDLLPFQGQQIWDATFRGRSLTMGSMFPEPVPTLDYLGTYGAFFLHCGLTAMGNPGPEDTHPVHGEIPNARYQSAELLVGRDGDGAYMALTGSYRHVVAFGPAYEARPVVRIGEGSSRIAIDMVAENLRTVPLELMYLAHINFRPIDGARLIDAVPDDAAHLTMRETMALGVISEEQKRLMAEVKADFSLHRQVGRARRIEPELVIFMKYAPGPDGWAHTLQLLPDGTADFVSHRPQELPFVTRWTTRTGDMEASGFALPATAEANGYLAEKAKGNVLQVPPKGTFRCRVLCGALSAGEAAEMRKAIEAERG